MQNLKIYTSAFFTLILLVFAAPLFAQVGINTDNSNPHPSAMLHVKSTNKGLLIPRMTSTQRTAIANPAKGLLVFDITTGSFWFYNGSAWEDWSATSVIDQIADADNNTKIQVEESNDEDIIRFDIAGTEVLRIKKNPGGETMVELPGNSKSTFFGESAGAASTTGTWNTFVGHNAGLVNTTGDSNTFVGGNAGLSNNSGRNNVYLGRRAGLNSTGSENVFLGTDSGRGATGSGNVFIGYDSGNNETGSNKLYIENSTTTNPLIYGEFDNKIIAINGKLGVGTSSPTNKFTVSGDADFTGNVGIGTSSPTNELTVSGDADFTGNVGIGTSSPTNELTVSGDADFTGNLGIGNENPAAELDIHGDNDNSVGALIIRRGSRNSFIQMQGPGGSPYSSKIRVAQLDTGNLTDAITISNSNSASFGNVGIGRDATSYKLEVEGDAFKSSPGGWKSNSDERLKTNIQKLDAEETLVKMLSLQGITYHWADDKTGTQRPEGMQYGFSAQNIQEVYPTLVEEDAHGYLQTSYGTFDAMQVEAMRALVNRMEEQQSAIEKLRLENQQLKAEVSKIDQLEATLLQLQDQIHVNNTPANN